MSNCSIDGNIQVGNRVKSSATFTNVADSYNPFDPARVLVEITAPDGTSNEYEYGIGTAIVRTSVGLYGVEFSLTDYGVWYVKWFAYDSVGAQVCLSEISFKVLSIVT